MPNLNPYAEQNILINLDKCPNKQPLLCLQYIVLEFNMSKIFLLLKNKTLKIIKQQQQQL